MRVIFMGTPEFAVPTLDHLIQSKHDVVGVVCQPDRPKGRGKKRVMPPVKILAMDHNLPVYQPETPNQAEFRQELRGLQPDVIIVAAYGHILKQKILDLPPSGCINVHASLLPKYRGAAPIQAAIFDGEPETGVTIMQMDRGMDTGDMLLKKATPIGPNETGSALEERLANIGAEALLEALDGLANGTITPESQNDDEATYAPKLVREDFLMDWRQSAAQIHNRVRALAPKPGVKSAIAELDLAVKIIETRIDDTERSAEPGLVLELDPKRGIRVATGAGTLWISRIHPQNRNIMDSGAFLRGHALETGMHFQSFIERGNQ